MPMTAFRSLAACILLALPASPPAAQDAGALDRLRDLAAPEVPAAGDIYADEIAADLALIAAEEEALFGPGRPGYGPEGAPARIVLFTGPDCEDCAAAEDELAALVRDLEVRAAIIDIAADPAGAALMKRLSLDLLPSYVMRDGMIRGAMPAIVLKGYLLR